MSKKKNDHSIDIRDICYFVDHVHDIDFRVSLIKDLGYSIGVNVATENSKLKEVTIGKRNEIRIQITPRTKHSKLVKCAIIR